MKILMINSLCGVRSTGRICTDLAMMLEERGHESKIAYGRGSVPEAFQKYAVRIGCERDVKIHGVKARLTGSAGFGSTAATKRFIKWVEEFDPDVIHLHNLHGYYLNVALLFQYLRQCGKPVLWSFYDCWCFTGHCAHFDYNQCDKWQEGCHHCEYLREYPRSYIDTTAENYNKKRKLFTGIPNLQLIVPSTWMRSMVEKSYMKDYPCHVLPNGIDTIRFYPRENAIKEKFDIGNKNLVLGVSSVWHDMKGLNHFNRLAKALDQEKYRLMLVGGNDKNKWIAPEILRVEHTDSIDELCQIYTAADVFVNPTLQETQGLTTIEAFACGTPGVVFCAGGAAECVDDTCGIAVEKDNFEALHQAILQICEKNSYTKEACIAKANSYDKTICYGAFMELYEKLNGVR